LGLGHVSHNKLQAICVIIPTGAVSIKTTFKSDSCLLGRSTYIKFLPRINIKSFNLMQAKVVVDH